MDTIKTAVVVVLLLAVLYGVYVVLNKPEQPIPADVAWHDQQSMTPLQVDLGGAPLAEMPDTIPAMPDASSSGASPSNLQQPPNFPPETDFAAADPAGMTPPEFLQPRTAPPDFSSSVPEQPDFAPPAAPGFSTVGTAETGQPAQDFAPPGEVPGEPYATDPPLESNSPVAPQPPTESGLDASEYAAAAAAAAATAVAATGGSSGELPMTDGPQTDVTSTQAPPINESPLDGMLQSATSKIESEQWYEALHTLSLAYLGTDLTQEQRKQLQGWLDPLAAKVIYSDEHHVEAAYEVRGTETLLEIAGQYDVPWQLLANINGISDPTVLVPRSKLKVVRGPFRAEVDTSTNELTLFAGKLYAGRFDVSVGSDPAPQPGQYRVNGKQPGRTYYAGDGRTIPANDPRNPFGGVWIDLGGDQCIHGSATTTGSDVRMGCISLSPVDANDLYGILSQGSTVIIR